MKMDPKYSLTTEQKVPPNDCIYSQSIAYLNSFSALESPASPECFVCMEGKVQIQCDTCLRSFHYRCLRPKKRVLLEVWVCQFCRDREERICRECGYEVANCDERESLGLKKNQQNLKLSSLPSKEVSSEPPSTMTQMIDSQGFRICTLCCLLYHRQCVDYPSKAQDSLQYSYFPHQHNFVCATCILNRGFTNAFMTFFENDSIFFFVKVRDLSPVHRCWVSQTTLKQLATKQRQKCFEYQKFEENICKQKIQKIFDFTLPKQYQNSSLEELYTILQKTGKFQKIKMFGGTQNFRFLVKWEKSQYSNLTWEDQNTVLNFQLPFARFLSSLLEKHQIDQQILTSQYLSKFPEVIFPNCQKKYPSSFSLKTQPFQKICLHINQSFQKDIVRLFLNFQKDKYKLKLLRYFDFHIKISKSQSQRSKICGVPLFLVTSSEDFSQWKQLLTAQYPLMNILSMSRVSSKDFNVILQKQLYFKGKSCNCANFQVGLFDYETFCEYAQEIGKIISMNSHKEVQVYQKAQLDLLVFDNFNCKYFQTIKKQLLFSRVLISMSMEVWQKTNIRRELTKFSLAHQRTIMLYRLDDILENLNQVPQTQTLPKEPIICSPDQGNINILKRQRPVNILPRTDRILIHQYLITFGCNKFETIEQFQRELQRFSKSKRTLLITQSGEKLWMHFQLYLSYLKDVPSEDIPNEPLQYYFFGFDARAVYKQICNMTKLYKLYEKYRNSPYLFQPVQVQEDSLIQITEGEQPRKISPLCRFVLVCLVLVKGYGQWNRILNSRKWVHYLGLFKNRINKDLAQRNFQQFIVKFYVKPSRWIEKHELIQRLISELNMIVAQPL